MGFTSYIHAELLALIPVLALAGAALKKWPTVPNENIPLLLGILGILLSAVWVLANNLAGPASAQGWLSAAFTAAVQGALVAGAAAYGHQLYRQGRGR